MMLPSNQSRSTPAYDLERIQQLVGQGALSRRITAAAVEGAHQLGWDDTHVVAAILHLTPGCFYKSMTAEKRPGLWQDVYHLQYQSAELYIKLQIDPYGIAVVVQFKPR